MIATNEFPVSQADYLRGVRFMHRTGAMPKTRVDELARAYHRARDEGIRLHALRQDSGAIIVGAYLATSAKTGQAAYVVDRIQPGCTCPAGLRGIVCKHLGAAMCADDAM